MNGHKPEFVTSIWKEQNQKYLNEVSDENSLTLLNFYMAIA
jgi:hypothetical protein